MAKKNYLAFTNKYNGLTRQLSTQCGVSDAIPLKSGDPIPASAKEYEAVWDTGATTTVITAKVAKDLGLKPIGLTTSHHAGGTEEVNSYLINVYLPNNIRVVGVRVVEAVLVGNLEMLVGMDIISLGDFSFTNFGGKSTFSFRIPSIKQVDYVAEDMKKAARRAPIPSSYQRRGRGKGKGKGRGKRK